MQPEPDMFGYGFRAGYSVGSRDVVRQVDTLLFAWSTSGNTTELVDRLADLVTSVRERDSQSDD